jgi:hypothetical protein
VEQNRLHCAMGLMPKYHGVCLLRYANDKGLTVNVSKCAVLVTGMRGIGGTVQYGNDNMPNVGEFCYLGMWMNKTMSMSFASRRMCGSMLAAWRQVLPVAIEHGVCDMPHAMMLLVRTFVLPRALFGVLTCCNFHHAASPAYSRSCCPFASTFWGCVAP